jgi:hypothetical protein
MRITLTQSGKETLLQWLITYAKVGFNLEFQVSIVQGMIKESIESNTSIVCTLLNSNTAKGYITDFYPSKYDYIIEGE